MNLRNLFAEMRRRSVYKVAVAYAVVAWLLIQVTTQHVPFFEIPSWCVRLVIVLLALGFPIAVVLAWAYELTPEGIKRAEDLPADQPINPNKGKRINVLIIGVLLCVIALLVYQRVRRGGAAPEGTEKSIAVLPFDNLATKKRTRFSRTESRTTS